MVDLIPLKRRLHVCETCVCICLSAFWSFEPSSDDASWILSLRELQDMFSEKILVEEVA